jgi:hypothetical protein
MANKLLRINQSTVPDYAWPQHVKVHRPPPTTTNLLGEPGGAQGFPWLVLRWDRASGRARRWWEAFIGEGRESVRLNYVAAPDTRATGTVTIGGTQYANHSAWSSGILWRPQFDEGVTHRWYTEGGTERDFDEGGMTIRISELGRRF